MPKNVANMRVVAVLLGALLIICNANSWFVVPNEAIALIATYLIGASAVATAKKLNGN